MLRMCVRMHFCLIENHLIRILEDGLLISKVVLSQWAGGNRLSQMWGLCFKGSSPDHVSNEPA
jgi:hypothetical protein